MLKIVENVKFLARQGLPLRGDESEENSNFNQLNKKDAKYDKIFQDWLEKKTQKYTSHDIQNEIIEIMAHKILRTIIEQIKNQEFYGIMADECTDVSNTEQLSFCVRFVSFFFDDKY